MKLLIAADLIIQSNNENAFEIANLEEILGTELKKLWLTSEYKTFNLEAPITNSIKKRDKCGPNLKINPKAINGILKLEPTFLLLSNNHIMDYGEDGYEETVSILKNNNIKYIGIGDNRKKLISSCVYKIGNKNIGFYNCCENEFSNIGEDFSGANNFDIYDTLTEIEKLKKKVDYLIVLYHGGKEYYRYPTPELKRRCEKMADIGADLIICQHSHCIGCEQNYNNSKIIYGQGNFIMGTLFNEYRNTSLIIELEIGEKIEVEYIPIIKTDIGTRLADINEKKEVLDSFFERSQKLLDDDFIKEEFEKFSNEHINFYLRIFKGNSLWLKIINKLTKNKMIDKMYSKKTLLAMLNFIECEAHRETLINGLRQKIKKMEK